MQVSQQRDRTRPPDSEETSMAGEGLWFVSKRVADVAGNRNRAHDREGPSEMGGKRRLGWPSSFHCRAIWPLLVNRFTIDDVFWLYIASPKLRNGTTIQTFNEEGT